MHMLDKDKKVNKRGDMTNWHREKPDRHINRKQE